MVLNSHEIAQMAADFKREFAQRDKTPTANKTQNRVKIVAGTKKTGDLVGGRTITGFGKTWIQYIPDHETSVWGLQPGRDYKLNIQYAYTD